jgi:nucleoside phosphorylase
MIPPRPTQRKDFEIAIICALRSEADAVEALFDIFWDDGKSYRKASGDPNAYTTGVIGSHNVVLAYMPGMGKSHAASVASSFRSSFEGIKLALVVGIYGGVPNGTDDEKEILLGDVIISDGLIQYDFGRQLPNTFIRKDTLQDSLGRPNTEIRALLAKLKGHRSRMRLKDNTSHYLT